MDVTTSDNSAIENLYLLYLLLKSLQQLLDNMFAIFSCLHRRNFFFFALSLSQILSPSVRCTGVRLFQHKHEHNGFFKGELQQFVK